MNKNLQNIDQVFKVGVGDFAEMPSAKVWDNIELALNKNAAPVSKTFFERYKKYAALLLLLLISTCSYFVVKNNLQNPLQSNYSNIKLDTLKATNKNYTNQATENKFDQNNISDKLNNKSKHDNIEQLFEEKNNVPLVKNSKTQSIKNTTEHSKNDANNDISIVQKYTSLKKSYNKQKQKIKISSALADNDEAAVEPATAALNDLRINETPEHTPPTKFIVANKLNDFAKPDFVTPSNINSIYKNLKSSTRKVKTSNSSLFVFYEPQINFNHLKDNNDKPDTQPAPQPGPNPGGGGQPPPTERKKEFDKNESKQKTYAFGAIFNKQINKHFGIITGATYFNKSIDILPKKIYAKLDDRGMVKYKFECSTGYTYIAAKSNATIAVGDSIVTNASKNITDYLCVPIGVSYSFNFGKFTVMPAIGASANFLLHQSIKTSFEQGSAKYEQESKDIFGLKSNYFSGFTNVNINYNLNKKIAISFAPAITVGLNSINKNTAVKAYNNAFGVRLGTTINF
jgi:hypothetical protein